MDFSPITDWIGIFGQTAILVALGEFGDKTQLVVLLLAIQLKSPWRVLAGVSLGAALIHLLSVWFGSWALNLFDRGWLNLILGFSFLIFGAFLFWSALRSRAVAMQEVCQDMKTPFRSWRKYPVITSGLVFFTAEMGDKTQLTTMALAAHFNQPAVVWLGAMSGLFLLNTLVICGGQKILGKISLSFLRFLSGVLFIVLGMWILFFGK